MTYTKKEKEVLVKHYTAVRAGIQKALDSDFVERTSKKWLNDRKKTGKSTLLDFTPETEGKKAMITLREWCDLQIRTNSK